MNQLPQPSHDPQISPAVNGFSLTELLLVIAMIAVISAIAVPAFSDINVRRLEVAASEVATALRYAREESVRTGTWHGVRKLDGENSIAVFRIDLTQIPPAEVYDVRHPIDLGSPYHIDLENLPKTRATTMLAYFSIYGDATAHQAISFNARGEPIDGVTGKPLGREYGGFLLNNDEYGTIVSLSRLSGRVTTAKIGAANSDPVAVF